MRHEILSPRAAVVMDGHASPSVGTDPAALLPPEAPDATLPLWGPGVAQELRSAVGLICGFTRALGYELDPGANGTRAGHYADRIGAAARRLTAALDGMDLLTWVECAPLVAREVDLGSLAAGILRELHAEEPLRAVRVHIAPDLRTVGDPRLLRILLDQLLGNAWKFTRPQGETRIAFSIAAGVDGQPVCCIRDNGAGFDPAYADKLFGPFQRLHSSTEFPGAGIGLACARRIVDRHGGQLWAESAEGRGAAFHFTLPGLPAVAAVAHGRRARASWINPSTAWPKRGSRKAPSRGIST